MKKPQGTLNRSSEKKEEKITMSTRYFLEIKGLVRPVEIMKKDYWERRKTLLSYRREIYDINMKTFRDFTEEFIINGVSIYLTRFTLKRTSYDED